jgi:hypothetical protein
MRKLEKSEFVQLIQDPTIGYIHFLGGKRSEGGGMIVSLREEHYFFPEDEVGNSEYNNMLEEQELESKEFYESYFDD